MRERAGHVGRARERVGPARGAPGDRHRHDRHRLVPRGLGDVVGPVDGEHVALLDRHPPVLRRSGHRDVPGHGARGLEVVRSRGEHAHGPAAARVGEERLQPARVQVANGLHERRVTIGDPLVAPHAVGIRVARGVREREAALLVGLAAQRVEDRVGLAALGVDPLRLDRDDPLGPRRAHRDEVDRVGQVHRVRRRDQVVDHVVHQPRLLGRVLQPEAARRVDDRLLLAGRVRRAPVDQPHSVVQVQDVHARGRAVGADQVGLEARDVAGDLRALHVRLDLDRVLAGRDVDRAELERDPLGARRHLRLLDACRRRPGLRGRRTDHERGEQDDEGQPEPTQSHAGEYGSRWARRRAVTPTRAPQNRFPYDGA